MPSSTDLPLTVMASDLEETVPLIFYSFFTITIVIILMRIKAGRAKYSRDISVKRRDKFQGKAVFDEDETQASELVYRSSEDASIESPVIGRQRNRHRNHRESKPNNKRVTSRHSCLNISPISRQWPCHFVSGKDKASIPSVYFSDVSALESEGKGSIESRTNEGLKSAVEESMISPDRQSVAGQYRTHQVETHKCQCDSLHRNSIELTRQGLSSKRANSDLDRSEMKHHTTIEKAVNHYQRCSSRPQCSKRKHKPTRGCEAADEKEALLKPNASFPSTLESSDEEVERFHVARPALPTTIASGGVCVDTFGQLDICSPPQNGVLLLRRVGTNCGACRTNAKGNNSNHSKGGSDTEATDLEPASETTSALVISASKETRANETDCFMPELKSVSSKSSQWVTYQEDELESSAPRQYGDCTRHDHKDNEAHGNSTIERATREVIAARVLQVSSSHSHNPTLGAADTKSMSREGFQEQTSPCQNLGRESRSHSIGKASARSKSRLIALDRSPPSGNPYGEPQSMDTESLMFASADSRRHVS